MKRAHVRQHRVWRGATLGRSHNTNTGGPRLGTCDQPVGRIGICTSHVRRHAIHQCDKGGLGISGRRILGNGKAVPPKGRRWGRTTCHGRSAGKHGAAFDLGSRTLTVGDGTGARTPQVGHRNVASFPFRLNGV